MANQVFSVGDVIRITNKLNDIAAAIAEDDAPVATTPTSTQNKRVATSAAIGDMITAMDAVLTAEQQRASVSSLNDISGATVTLASGSFTYDGIEKTQVVASVVLNSVTLTAGTDYVILGNTGTNAGSYTLQVCGINNYYGTNNVSWSIAKATTSVIAPTAKTGLAYDGTEKALINAGGVSTGATLQYSLDDTNYSTNIPSGTNVGTYTVYYRAVGDANHTDVSADTLTVTISKGTRTVTLSSSSVSLSGVGSTDTITVTRDGSATITANPVNSSVCTASVNGNTVTITAVGDGTTTVFISCNGDSNWNYENKALSVTVQTNQYTAMLSTLLNGNIGDEVEVPYTTTDGTEYTSIWCVADKRTVELEDGTTKQGVVLQAKYCFPESIQFDEPEPSHSNSNVQSYGLNSWKKSGVRQWLNNDGVAGSWWTAQTATDVAPSQHSTLNSFIHNLDPDFVAAVSKVKVLTLANTVTESGVTETTYDKFFLPSKAEVYGETNATEGPEFAYWKNKTGLSSPSDNSNSGRIIYDLSAKSTARLVWLRSAIRSSASYVRIVNTNGNVSYSIAGNARWVAPACVIC